MEFIDIIFTKDVTLTAVKGISNDTPQTMEDTFKEGECIFDLHVEFSCDTEIEVQFPDGEICTIPTDCYREMTEEDYDKYDEEE